MIIHTTLHIIARCLLVAALPFCSLAAEAPVLKLTQFLAHTRSLSAEFTQLTLNEAGQTKQTSYGEFYLQRPGKFRWNYTKPFKQDIVSTEGKVAFYDQDLDQVTIKKLDDSVGSTPALLLSSDISLEENYTMQEQGTEGDVEWVKLVPKNEASSFKYLLIGLQNGLLNGMELSDNFGGLTRIYFTKVIANPSLPTHVFDFTPPAGVDVFSD